VSVQDRTHSTASPTVPTRKTAAKGDSTVPRRSTPSASTGTRVLAVLRIAMGLTFLWAFVDKMFGLGYATSSAQAWIHGGSPTTGFLAHVEVGPLQAMLRDLAATGVADWLFMLALLGIGAALLFGVGMRLAATAGVLLLASMWIAQWPLARFTSGGTATASTNPLIDYHVVYIVVVILLAVFAAGDRWGLGRRWARLDIVGQHGWLR
jgi:thiosulfate dehydrogenase (quinone) large subunit